MRQQSFDSGSKAHRVLRLAFVPLALLCPVFPAMLYAAGTITYVQGNATDPQAPQTTVGIPFTAAQAAGNLNVVAVGWNDTTAAVVSVTDTSGNTYTRAVGPTALAGFASQSLYYAKNIVAAGAGANSVTVTFSLGAAYPDIRIAEYAGVDPVNPVDVTAARSGSNTTSSSGAVTTTNANDLLFGANMVETLTTGPGASFTRRIITQPDGDIMEDRMVTTTGSYSATAPVSPAGRWVMQMIAFRAAGGTSVAPPTAPSNLTATAASATQINLSWTASTSTIGLANYSIERCQGAACSTFAQIASVAGTVTTYNNTGLTGGTSYSYRVRATDTASTLGPYSTVATTVTQTPPTTPGSLTATAVSTSQINLSWTASTSSIGLANYIVQRCQGAGCANFAQIASLAAATTTYSDTGLASSSSYSYRVQASDTAGNLSAFSGVATTATQGPPTAPSNLTATAASASQINLSWTASTSSIGLANYLIEQCQGTGCANFTQIASVAGTVTTYNNTGLTGGATYTYRVRANDTASNLSAYSNTAGATTQTPPTAPGSFTATAASASQINLSWTASTSTVGLANYLIEQCPGTGCTNFTQIASVAGTVTTYNNTGLTGGATYTYRVRANDTASNLSAYSNTAGATTQTPPTAPGGFTATAVSTSQINLSWTASTSTVGLANYLIEQCPGTGCTNFTQIASVAGTVTTYNNTGLTGGATYTYRVRANDTASNLSAYSNTAGATTQTPPTAPGSFTATAASASQIDLSWTASTSTIGLANYIVQRCQGAGCANFAQIALLAAATTTYSDTGLASSSSYSYRVQASDTAGNLSGFSGVATTATQGPPTAPSNLTATAASASQINLSWTASTSSIGLANYLIEQCQGTGCANFTQIASVAGTVTSYNNTGLTAATSYSYRVRAADTASNMSSYSNAASASTQTPPTAPGTLTATAANTSQINLSWTASASTVGLANYLIEQCQGTGCTNFTQIASVAGAVTAYNNTGLTASTTYSYRVRAIDTASNLGAYSNGASAATPAPQPPTAPGSLTATAASTTQINLSWTASSSNVGLANYIVQRCQGAACTNFAQVATPAGTTYNDTGLAANTSYSYQVQAVDTSGALSPFSNAASATTIAAAVTITYVQGNAADPQASQTTVGIPFTAAQTAGNLNVVAVGWNDTTAAVVSVTDTSGNTYTRAAGPTVRAGFASQSLYYANNIAAAGANSVTVTFSPSAAYPDIRIAEYAGVDPVNPVDVTAAGSGNSATSSSGAVTTTNANDLLFGANMVETLTTGPGAGFTRRIITQPDGDIMEDRMVTATGSYSATAPVSPAGQWIMQMIAFRAAGGTSVAPPTAPSNLTATAASATQINLSWTASTSTIGLANYSIERCQGAACSTFAQIASVAGTVTTYNNTGLTGGTSYSYRVRATDTASTLGPYSTVATTVTQTPPTTPGSLTATAVSTTQINLSWTASTSSIGLANYIVQRCQGAGCANFAQIASLAAATTTYSDTGLASSSSYSYRVQASDTAGNLSAFSGVATTATQGPPTAPSSLTATAVSTSQINLSWTASTSSIGLANYLIEQCQGTGCANFTQIASVAGTVTSYNNTGLTAATSYSYRVQAADTASNMSSYSNAASASTQTPPTAPGTLTATTANTSQINLSWTASASTVGLANYLIEQCQGTGCTNFTQIASVAGAVTTYNNTGLTASTTYSYRVRAIDTASNLSAYSNGASASTPAPQPPTAPGSLTATAASAGQINLSWTASSSNVGLANYIVQRCQGAACTNFAQVATPAGTTYNDTGLAANTSYSYQVQAVDTSGALSPFSNAASATTIAAAVTITYVQGNAADPQASQTTVGIPFTAAQAAGNLNVVVVGWNDTTAAVVSVADTSGNTYTRAVGPTAIAGLASQSLYYANNITAAGANSVTVTFSPSAAYPDIRIAEYAGVDPVNPVDVTAASSGSNATSSSGAVTTTNANDLLFGANIVQTLTTGPGAGFTNRIITQPDGDIMEDRMVTATGSYSATAPVSPAGQWIMQMIAFRAGGTSAAPPTAPGNLSATASGTQVNLSWTASTSSVGVANYVLQRCQGAGCTTFVQIASVPSPGVTYNDTGLASATYSYRVQAVDISGNPSPFSNAASATISSGMVISPQVTTLTSTRTQQFTSNNTNVVWQVDGVIGGSAGTGTISATGLYTPPATAGTHIVTVSFTDLSQPTNATVYISNYAGTFTRDIDNLRTGLNPNETVLTPANVNTTQFGKLFSYAIDGTADASPLYVANVNIPGKGFRNVVYIATEHDSVYAFDADGLQSTPLWKVSFINPAAGITPVPPNDTGECCDISPEIGITGSPVIDPATNTLYVVAKTKETAGGTKYFHRLHALDIVTGAEKFGGPVVIQASVPGTGGGSSGGQVPFISLRENQRAALLLSNGVVYIAFAAHGDQVPYHGWVIGYNPSTLQQVMRYCTSPNDSGRGSGIWMSGDGLATDSAGNIYFVTGNGGFDANIGGSSYGDSLVKISTAGAVLDYFTPFDQQHMNDFDLDLGSGGVLILPDQPGPHPHLALTAGKNGTIYLVDRDNMGHYNPNNNNQIVQSLVNIFPGGTQITGNFKAPVYWNGTLYYSPDADFIKSFPLVNGQLSTTPASMSSIIPHYPGATLGMSSNGATNGILWAIQRVDLDPFGGGVTGPGSLHAFDATNLGIELYNSNQNVPRDGLDFTAKWSAPLVANGKVYVATLGQIAIFGLLP